MRHIVAIAAATLVALVANAWFVSRGIALDVLVPPPAKVVRGFVTALAAGRPDRARDALSEPARNEISVDRLRWIDERLRNRFGVYHVVPLETVVREESATTGARLQPGRGDPVHVTFSLVRERPARLWKIDGLGSLEALAGDHAAL
jgi:hypothetical protein